MKRLLPLATLIAMFAISPTAFAQRPGGRGGRPAGPPPGMDQADQNVQNQQLGNQRFGNPNNLNQNNANQNVANQNMPTIDELAQMMIANFDADGSGGLDQAELQTALTALRQYMQNANNGQNQGGGNQQGNVANAQNQFQGGALGQNNQGLGVDAGAQQRRNGPANNLRGRGR